jgi:predicted acylesterase/phospholipase RssA
LVLRPDVHSLAWDDFDRADEAIEAGAAAARSALPRIQKFLARGPNMRECNAQELTQLRLAEAVR